MTANPVLYEMLGGKDAVDAVVEKFYHKIMGDDELAPFFKGIDIEHQMFKQRVFLTYAFGGTSAYKGKTLRKAHAKAVEHGLNEHHFNLVAKHLVESLHDLSVREDLIDCVMEIVASTKDDVLGL